MTYRQFLIGLRLAHFSPNEVLDYANRMRNGVKNALPPENLWENLVPTIQVLDLARRTGTLKAITLTSIYRSPAYNAAVGGASQSQHKRNAALDIKVKGMSPSMVFNRLVKLRQAGAFKGGLGKYSTFVHIDTRGNNATW